MGPANGPGRRDRGHPILGVLEDEGRMIAWLAAQTGRHRPGGRAYARSYLSRVFHGRVPVTTEVAAVCARVLQRKPSELFNPPIGRGRGPPAASAG